MRFEQDYIMRLVHEIARTLIMLVFRIDIDKEEKELEFSQAQSKALYHRLLDMAGQGRINEAENLLWEFTEQKTGDGLLMGMLFYEHINQLRDGFLKENGYSREEIKEGMKNLLEYYGYDWAWETFTK